MSKTLLLDDLPGDRSGTDLDTLIHACHVLAVQGHAAGLAGQVSTRQGHDGSMLTLVLGVGLEEASADSVVLVDDELRTVRGEGRPNPAVRFHSWIYRHHPEVHAIVHTHPPALSAFSMLGRPMPVAHMDAAMFHDDCGFLAQWPGVPTGDDEGRLISAALGQKRSVMLANHGIVCTGATLAEAVYLTVFAERNARHCLDALAVGELQPISAEAAAEAHDFLLQPAVVDGTFNYWVRQAQRSLSV